LTVLFGEGAPAAGGPAGGDGQSMLIGLLPFVAIFVLFYFLLIRPQRREQARRQEMLSAVKKNDRVITAGGIYGVVTNVHREADEVTIKVDEATNTKLRVTLSSIARIMGDEPSEDSASK
jgi:preprotein translocase subunit YajC